MDKKIIQYLIVLFLFVIPSTTFAQLGVRGGVNVASEDFVYEKNGILNNFKSNNLSGFQIGLIYQANPKNTGLGLELGALFSQKGGSFLLEEQNILGSIVKGYHEVNYIDVPLNLKFQIGFFNKIQLFATGGIYGSYFLNGKTVFEGVEWEEILVNDSFDDLLDKIDYGYSIGAGIGFFHKLQLGLSLSNGLQKREANSDINKFITLDNGVKVPNIQSIKNNKLISLHLTYLL